MDRATCVRLYQISIHALREEGDQDCCQLHQRQCISIHALREEGDFMRFVVHIQPVPFLSTPSARRATFLASLIQSNGCISIHALREEGDQRFYCCAAGQPISIHALREEGDIPYYNRAAVLSYFYPRPPRGGRRIALFLLQQVCQISIHALREEGDVIAAVIAGFVASISIHALREEGDTSATGRLTVHSRFLSTPSARRATSSSCKPTVYRSISIHALREEGDSKNRDKISIFKQIIQHSARI